MYIACLETITLDNNTFDFAVFVLRSANIINKNVTFIIPERFAYKCKCRVEEDEMDHVTIIDEPYLTQKNWPPFYTYGLVD